VTWLEVYGLGLFGLGIWGLTLALGNIVLIISVDMFKINAY